MMVQAASQLDSLSNTVRRTNLFGPSVIRKRYSRRGRRNGYRLPLSRVLVETLLLDWLSKLIVAEREYLVIPRLIRLDGDQSALWMTDLGGVPLDQCLAAALPAPENFAAMGRVCARLEQSSGDIMLDVPRDTWTAQDGIRRDVIDRRIRNVTSEQTHLLAEFAEALSSPSVICLGDLCFANLLSCDGRIGMVDFEFAHVGHPGRDVGRVVAQLNAQAARDSVASRVFTRRSEALLTGFADCGGSIDHAQKWATILACYYSDSDPRGATVALQGRS